VISGCSGIIIDFQILSLSAVFERNVKRTVAISNREDRLFQSLKPVVEPLGVDLIDVEIKTHGERPTVRVVIDSDDGVDSGVCTRVSRNISPVLDVEDPGFSGSYDLQVSSPGLERKLRRPGEFERFQGEEIEITCYEPYQDRKQWVGVLVDVRSDAVVLEIDDGSDVSIPDDKIASARLHFDAEAALKSEGADKNE